MIDLSSEEYWAMIKWDFYTYVQRVFCELNPGVEFLPNWHLELISAKLEACFRREITRLIINVPPRSGKSQCVNVASTTFLLGHNPSAQIISASYGQDLSEKHALDCRTIMETDWYQRIFPTRLSKRALQELTTTERGVRYATSVGGPLTGKGGDFIIIDDSLKPDEAVSDAGRNSANNWYDNTVLSRLNDKRTGCIIIVEQRLHVDDLSGHVLENGEEWDVLSLPAIAEQDETHIIRTPFGTRTVYRKAGEALHPEREPLSVLKNLRRTMGEYNFAGQYQQRPGPLGGGLVKVGWFQYYVPGEEPAKFDLIFQSWDTANKATELSDYSVCTTWGMKRKRLYLLDVFRERLQYPDLKRAVLQQAMRLKATTVLIEDKASGTQLIQELIREGAYGITRYDPKGLDKTMRLHSITSMIENHFVYLPTEAPWSDVFLSELGNYPRSKYNDQVDSVSQALNWVMDRPSTTGLIDYYRSEAIRLGLPREPWMGIDDEDDEKQRTGTDPITGQRLRWNGKDWVDYHTAEIYIDAE